MFPVPLPTELVLLIVSNLPVSSIRSLLLTSREWFNLLDQNRTTIYRDAAIVEGYLGTAAALGVDELVANPIAGLGKSTVYSQSAMKGINDWQGFCKRRKLIERSWAGRDGSSVVPSPRPGLNIGQAAHHNNIHRIKVDENAGITMATSHFGGLVVRDLESDDVLWELPTWYVRAFAHLEYSEGYMVFDRQDGNKEVWRRTVDLDNAERGSDLQVEERSKPDQLQRQVASYINRLGRNTDANAKAQFTPHAVLQFPESTRAYRFVFPTLLVASLESAYLMDARTGELVQMISGIQIINSPDLAQVPNPSGNEDEKEDEEEVPVEDDDISIDTDDDDDDNQPTRFLGLIRYVDLSERHVFFAGRYLIRIFSRKTGKCVMDIPSTRWRYGKWRWEVASRESVGKDNSDSYPKAKAEEREVVRMPTKFTLEEYSPLSKIVIDQFVAVHVSKDGKHLVAMLSGSRLVIMHNFEAFLYLPVEPLSSSNNSNTSISTRPETEGSTSSSVASSSSAAPVAIPQSAGDPDAKSTKPHETRRQRIIREREARRSLRRAKDAKDEEIFEHTIDVQLGSPCASSSIYLAYENGRIGVVTSNAVYVVIPPNPPPRVGETIIDVPTLSILRLPYFSNPSWLSEVSCLMMSDTGLYLNWNPSWPPLLEMAPQNLDPEQEQLFTDEDQAALLSADFTNVTDSIIGSPNGDGDFEIDEAAITARFTRLFEARKKAWVFQWENEYENDLVEYERNEDSRYLTTPSGDTFVTPRTRDLNVSGLSTIYRVDYVSHAVDDEAQ